MAKTPSTTKLRQRTISGRDEVVVPSKSRPQKPRAKEITKRELATLDPGTPGRQAGEAARLERRAKVITRDGPVQKPTQKRVGKRRPRQGRAIEAAEQRAKTPSRRAGNRKPDASARSVPVTRRHKGARGARG